MSHACKQTATAYHIVAGADPAPSGASSRPVAAAFAAALEPGAGPLLQRGLLQASVPAGRAARRCSEQNHRSCGRWAFELPTHSAGSEPLDEALSALGMVHDRPGLSLFFPGAAGNPRLHAPARCGIGCGATASGGPERFPRVTHMDRMDRMDRMDGPRYAMHSAVRSRYGMGWMDSAAAALYV